MEKEKLLGSMEISQEIIDEVTRDVKDIAQFKNKIEEYTK